MPPPPPKSMANNSLVGVFSGPGNTPPLTKAHDGRCAYGFTNLLVIYLTLQHECHHHQRVWLTSLWWGYFQDADTLPLSKAHDGRKH